MILDRGSEDWLERAKTIGAELGVENRAPIAARRERMRLLSDRLYSEFGAEHDWDVEVDTYGIPRGNGQIRVRRYRPRGVTRPLPVYLVLHGGAFWLGSIDEKINEAFCSDRAIRAEFAVFDVDYGLAPERPFPAGLEDAYLALTWIVEHADVLELDVGRLVVGGVSAGGNLAAALCLLARDRGGPLILAQILEVPVVDLRDDAAWMTEHARINNLDEPAQMRNAYAPGVDASEPYLSPSLGDLAGLPATHVMTAEVDPLRDRAEQYVTMLRAAGNDVTGTRHLGQLHGSSGLTGRLRASRLWHDEVIAVLRDLARRM